MVTYEQIDGGKDGKFMLIGTSQGSFADCTANNQNLFVEVDDLSILEFLRREGYGKG